MASADLTIVRDFYATWNPEYLHPEVEWRLARSFPNGGVYRGASAVFQEWWPKHSATFSEWRAEPEHFLDAGWAVVVLGRYHGRAAASGVAFEVPFAHIWWMDGRRIIAFDQHCDTYVIQNALRSEAAAA